MAGNTFGTVFRLTTFGESHGPALGGVVDGCPAGVIIDEAAIQAELDRRRPGQGGIAVTARSEPD
ncbi:MAG TPA: chorismate synthase, partial [Desulfomicrobium sp.]|nr:chorismate synthase [Desulfomicrobium sp.]